MKTFVRWIIWIVVLAGLGWGGRLGWQKISPGLFGTKKQEKIPVAKARTATIAE